MQARFEFLHRVDHTLRGPLLFGEFSIHADYGEGLRTNLLGKPTR
jgi:hypothetical protein